MTNTVIWGERISKTKSRGKPVRLNYHPQRVPLAPANGQEEWESNDAHLRCTKIKSNHHSKRISNKNIVTRPHPLYPNIPKTRHRQTCSLGQRCTPFHDKSSRGQGASFHASCPLHSTHCPAGLCSGVTMSSSPLISWSTTCQGQLPLSLSHLLERFNSCNPLSVMLYLDRERKNESDDVVSLHTHHHIRFAPPPPFSLPPRAIPAS
jgi:hypothetical protein